MWIATAHRWNSDAAFLAACDAAGWSRGPGNRPIPGDGIVLDVIGPSIDPPTMVDGVIVPGAIDARWHVNVARIGVDLPASFVAATVTPATPRRGFNLPPPATPELPPVPATVPAWAFKALLREANRFAAARTAVDAAGGRQKDAWDGKPNWSRTSPLIATIATALSLTGPQLDQMFRDAEAAAE